MSTGWSFSRRRFHACACGEERNVRLICCRGIVEVRIDAVVVVGHEISAKGVMLCCNCFVEVCDWS